MNKVFFIVFIVSLLIACHSSSKEDKAGLKKITIDFLPESTVQFNDVFDSIRYVVLKETEESLFGYITKLKIMNDYIVIYDGRTQKILTFDMDGNSVGVINKQGRGVGEYVAVTDIATDMKNNHILVLDINKQAIHYYDIHGNFIESKTLPKDNLAFSFYYFDNSLYTVRGLQFKGTKDYPLVTMYKMPDLTYVNTYYPASKEITSLGMHGEPVGMMSVNKDTVYSVSVADYYISKINGQGRLENVYQLDIDDRYKIQNLPEMGVEEFMKSASMKYVYQLSNLVVNDNFVYFNYNGLYNVLYDITRQKSVTWKNMSYKEQVSPQTFIGNYGNWLVCQMFQTSFGYDSISRNSEDEGERALMFFRVKASEK